VVKWKYIYLTVVHRFN